MPGKDITATAVRRVVVAACVLGVAAMIASAVTRHVGAVVTFGLVTASAIVCLMVATAVAQPPSRPGPSAPDEEQARVVEGLVRSIVAAGTSEDEARRLVREAYRLGRSTRR